MSVVFRKVLDCGIDGLTFRSRVKKIGTHQEKRDHPLMSWFVGKAIVWCSGFDAYITQNQTTSSCTRCLAVLPATNNTKRWTRSSPPNHVPRYAAILVFSFGVFVKAEWPTEVARFVFVIVFEACGLSIIRTIKGRNPTNLCYIQYRGHARFCTDIHCLKCDDMLMSSRLQIYIYMSVGTHHHYILLFFVRLMCTGFRDNRRSGALGATLKDSCSSASRALKLDTMASAHSNSPTTGEFCTGYILVDFVLLNKIALTLPRPRPQIHPNILRPHVHGQKSSFVRIFFPYR